MKRNLLVCALLLTAVLLVGCKKVSTKYAGTEEPRDNPPYTATINRQ
ncbi:MAG: hypothetical protein K1X83_13485 [Oligoflexia bacterium]|nr:hypothetical protein [Oligoflexia bacterium]